MIFSTNWTQLASILRKHELRLYETTKTTLVARYMN